MRMRSALFVLLAPATLLAQREPLRQATAVPVELASLLAAAGGFPASGEPQILVGDIPGFAAERIHIPEGSVVLGSAFLGTTMVAIVQTLEGAELPVAQLEAELMKKGWKKPVMPTSQMGGFRPAPTPSSGAAGAAGSQWPLRFCAGQESLTLSRGAPRQGKQPLIIRMSTGTGYGICNPPQMGSNRRQVPLPTLYNPEGATENRDMMSFGECTTARPNYNNSNGTGARLRTAMAPEAMLEHYGRQLQDSGWTAEGTTTNVGRRWTRVDTAGKTIQARLNVTTASENPTCRELQLMVSELEKP